MTMGPKTSGPCYWLTNFGSSAQLQRAVVAILDISKTPLKCMGKLWMPPNFFIPKTDLFQIWYKYFGGGPLPKITRYGVNKPEMEIWEGFKFQIFSIEEMNRICLANFCIVRIGPKFDMPSVLRQTPPGARGQKRRVQFAIGMNGNNFEDPGAKFTDGLRTILRPFLR